MICGKLVAAIVIYYFVHVVISISHLTHILHFTYLYIIDHTYAGTSTAYSIDPPKITKRQSRHTNRHYGSMLIIYKYYVIWDYYRYKCVILQDFKKHG